MKKEGKKMGAFIDQVQKNNRLQAEALTYKQEERKRKEAEKAKKEQEKQEKNNLQVYYAEVANSLSIEFGKIFEDYGDIERPKAHCFLLSNRNEIIGRAVANIPKVENFSNPALEASENQDMIKHVESIPDSIGKEYADKNYHRIYKQVETKYEQHFDALEVYKENERLKQVEKEIQEEQQTKKYKFMQAWDDIGTLGEGLGLLLKTLFYGIVGFGGLYLLIRYFKIAVILAILSIFFPIIMMSGKK